MPLVLKSPLFWVLLILIGGAVLFVWKLQRKSSWGFREAVKNPTSWVAQTEKNRRSADRDVAAAQQWDSAQINQAVRHFIFEVDTARNAGSQGRVLNSLGRRVLPALEEILGDKALHPKLTIPTGTDLLPEAPLNRVCDLLSEEAPANDTLMELLKPFQGDPSSQIRKDVGMVFGNMGKAAAVPLIQTAFSDSDEYVRSHTLIGLKRAVKAGRLESQCASQLVPDLKNLIVQNRNADAATRLLLEFDSVGGAEFLLSPVILTPTSKALHHALRALAGGNIAVPRERLLYLITELEKSDLRYPEDGALGVALSQLGQHKVAEDLSVLDSHTSHSNESVAEGAAAGMLAFHGLLGFLEKLWKKEEVKGLAGLSVAERHYLAVSQLDSEVNNGGHSQYFFNYSGDTWRDALAGLEAMGMKKRAAILREAVGKFGRNEPSENNDLRRDQLAKISRKDDELFDTLDSRYYDCDEEIGVATCKYAIANAAAFK